MKALAAALVAAQKDMPKVERTGINPHFGSRFVTLDHLISKTRPVLAKHGLSIVQQLATSDAGAPALTTTLLHESGEQLSSTLPLPLVTDMQKLGAAITYARRYAWASALAICDEDDDDGNSVSGGSTGGLSAGVGPDGADGKGAAASKPAAPKNSDPGGFVWKYGPHAGTARKDTPLEYVMEYAQTGKVDWLREKCRAFIDAEGVGATAYDPDDDVPF